MMRVIPQRYAGQLRDIVVPPPPSYSSDETIRQLKMTRSHTASPAFDPVFCQAVDKDMVPAICGVAAAHGADVDPDEVREILADLIPVILRLKYHFNFPRPWQVSHAVGLPLRRIVSESALTPSYPSGHAIQAATACSALAERFPHAARPLDDVAGAIGATRLQLGVHFPMDVRVGLKIGRQIGRRIA